MKNNQFTVETLMCNLIHNWHEVVFLYSIKNPETDNWDDVVICKWNDEYYQEHKEELHKEVIDFITVTNKEIRVFLRK